MTGIVIQARQGSTRLPNKMNLPFYNDLTILDILIISLKREFSQYPIILATSINSNDDSIYAKGIEHNIVVFRGNEENVLQRFEKAATENGLSKIIRICADNPFLNTTALQKLIRESKKADYDYISYNTSKGIPSIKTHYGFWAEIVKTESLKKILTLTSDPIFLEHVTNYIYLNPSRFSTFFLSIPKYIEEKNIRLTIDTEEDFQLAKLIYQKAQKGDVKSSLKKLVDMIEENKEWLINMEKQIIKNSK